MKLVTPNLFSRRRYSDLVLDAIFCLWLIHIMLTGHLVPSVIVDLLRDDAPIAAVSEPIDGQQTPNGLSEQLPGT